MQLHPDSALKVLESIPSPQKMNKIHYAEYCLLLTEAQDKMYYSFTSDSVILIATNYYETKNDRQKLPKAYYYMGRIHQELNEIPYALEYYLKAENNAGENFEDARLMSRIYNSIGSIYTQLHIYEDALNAYKKAEYYLYACEDSVGLPFVLRDMARIYHVTTKLDSAEYCYDQAIKLAMNTQNKYALSSSLTEIANLFIQRKKYNKAFDYLSLLLENQKQKALSEQTALVYADIYLNTGRIDSAKYYLNQSLLSRNIYTKAASYNKLHQIKKEEESYKQALEYAEIYSSYKDSIQKIVNRESALRIQNLYNFQKLTREKENIEQMHHKNKQQMVSLFYISISLTLIAILLFLYQKQRRRNELLVQEKLMKLKEEQYAKSQDKVKENLVQIELLKNKLQENEELFTKQMELLEYENNRINLARQNQDIQCEKLISSQVYLKLKETAPTKAMKVEVWQELHKTVDEIYERFGNKLRNYYPKISEREEKVCYLIKANFSVTEIANLVGLTKSAVTLCRKRLFEKIHKIPGSGEDLDLFLKNL